MLKAQDAAGQILDASNRETLTMLVQDGKDNIDEKTKEEQEEQEKVKEEKEEKQEKVDEQKQIQKILKDNKLINEDLKGIEIDFNF